MVIMYGTRVFKKIYGEKQESCPVCHNHTMTFLRTSTWVYFLLPIPLFPVSFKYWKHCKFCDTAWRYKNKAELMAEFNKPVEELPKDDPIDITRERRQITISRKARSGKGPAFNVYVENQLVAKLEKDQPSVTFMTDYKSRGVFVKLAKKEKVISNIVSLKEGPDGAEYQISLSIDWEDVFLFNKDESKK